MSSLKSKQVAAIFFRGPLLVLSQHPIEHTSLSDISATIIQAIRRYLSMSINPTFTCALRPATNKPHDDVARHDSVTLEAASGYNKFPVHEPLVTTTQEMDHNDLTSDFLDTQTPVAPRTSPKDSVFGTPELFHKILAELGPLPLRNAMLVSRHFHIAIAPETASPQVKKALGIAHHKRASKLTPAEIIGFTIPFEVDYARPSEYLNVSIGEKKPPRHGPVPCLYIEPYVGSVIMYEAKGTFMNINVSLIASEVSKECNMVYNKGVVRNHFDGKGKLDYIDPIAQSWGAIKILKEAMEVRVTVEVDYRAAMGQAAHPYGLCSLPNCQIGRYGQQRVSGLLSCIFCILVPC